MDHCKCPAVNCLVLLLVSAVIGAAFVYLAVVGLAPFVRSAASYMLVLAMANVTLIVQNRASKTAMEPCEINSICLYDNCLLFGAIGTLLAGLLSFTLAEGIAVLNLILTFLLWFFFSCMILSSAFLLNYSRKCLCACEKKQLP